MSSLRKTVSLLVARRMSAPVLCVRGPLLVLCVQRPYSKSWSGSRKTRYGQPNSINVRSTLSRPAEEQEFYDYHLAKRLHHYELHEVTGTWLEALVPERSRAPTPIQGEENPLKVFTDMHANMEVAVSCLERIIGSAHRAEKDKDTVRETFDVQQLGHRALLWLLNSEAYKRFDLLLYPKFIKLVAHALAAQKADDHLWRLMLVPELPASFSTSELYASRWKSRVLRALVEACAYWSPESDAFNRSYACFKRAFKSTEELRQNPQLYVPKSSAGMFLESLLRRVPQSSVDVDVFNGFISSLKVWSSSDKSAFALKKSRMYLRHPTDPSADFALNLLREIGDTSNRSNGISNILGNRGEKGSSMLWMYYLETAQLLEKQGRPEDARWVLDFARSEMPAYFHKGTKGTKGTKSDRHPLSRNAETFHKRLPTETEKRIGVPVDKDGYLSVDAQGESYWRAAKAAEYDRRLTPTGR